MTVEADQITRNVLSEVWGERVKQDVQWGEQNHPDGTGSHLYQEVAAEIKAANDVRAVTGEITWMHILSEEFAESQAEEDVALLRAELIQVAAVAVAWVEAIDRRQR